VDEHGPVISVSSVMSFVTPSEGISGTQHMVEKAAV